MKRIFILLILKFITFSLIKISSSCFTLRENTLCTCIGANIKNMKFHKFNKFKVDNSHNINFNALSKCVSKYIVNQKNNHIKDFVNGLSSTKSLNLYDRRLKMRETSAYQCLNDIDIYPKSNIPPAILCCIGKNSHFGKNYIYWKDDDYIETFKDCINEKKYIPEDCNLAFD